MSKQSGGEVLFNNFRKMVNDGNIYIVEKRNDELVCLKEAKYLIGNEYNELEKVAKTNKAKYDKLDDDERNAKELALEKRFTQIINDLLVVKEDLQKKYDKQVAINNTILELLKITYGASPLDYGIIIALLEKEIKENV